MKVLSQQERYCLQNELGALLNRYGIPYGYVVSCTGDGFVAVTETPEVSQQLRYLSTATLNAIKAMGALPAPSISDN